MTNFRRTLLVLAVASVLTLAGCTSGQDEAPAAQATGATGATGEALSADQVSVVVTLQGMPTLSADGQSIDVTANLANNGKTTLTSSGAHAVNLGAHSVDASGKMIEQDLTRAHIPDIAPATQAAVTIHLPVNQILGKSAQIMPVQEGVAWFDSWGTKPLTVGPFTSCASPTTGKVCDASGKPLATAAN